MELKLDLGTGQVTGYASLFGLPADAVGDVVQPGAFRASLARGLPQMLREHKGQPVGAWTEAVEDDLGLKVRGVVTDQATLDDLRAGRLGGLSIGFAAMKTSRTGRVRNLEQVELHEVSFGRRPVNSRARVLAVKAKQMDDQVEVKDADAPGADVLMQKIDGIAGDLSKLAARVEKVEVKAARPGAAATEPKGDAEHKAFTAFIRRGVEGLDPLERKDLVVSNDTAGGFLAPEAFISELLKNAVFYSPIRSLARVTQINSGAVILPKRTGTLTGGWVGETSARPESQPAYGQNRYETRELAVYCDISNQMLEDSAINIASELAMDFAEQFGYLEGKAFLQGAGPLQPEGILTNGAIASTVSGHASQVTADGLIKLYHDLLPAYRANAVWVMNSATLAVVRQLKTADASAQYLFWPSQQLGGTPGGSILGRPIVEAPDLDDVAAGKFPILFGDFLQAYRIFDRVSLSVLRDPYSQAANGLTRFHARRRLAAGVGKAESIRKLKVAAS